jgi:hypothetical protein
MISKIHIPALGRPPSGQAYNASEQLRALLQSDALGGLAMGSLEDEALTAGTVTMRKWGWSKQFGTIGYWIPPCYPRISSFRDFFKGCIVKGSFSSLFWLLLDCKMLGFQPCKQEPLLLIGQWFLDLLWLQHD